MKFFASAARGTEGALRDELRTIRLPRVKADRGGVHFEGTLDDAMRACLRSHLAMRVLVELGTFAAHDADDLYAGVRAAVDGEGDGGGLGVEGVLDELLHHGRGTFDDLAGRDLVRHIGRQQRDTSHRGTRTLPPFAPRAPRTSIDPSDGAVIASDGRRRGPLSSVSRA